MKTPEEITRWCDMMLNRHPNIEDTNFFNSIKDYMKDIEADEMLDRAGICLVWQSTGEWISMKSDDLKISDYKCSCCGHWTDDNIFNFCPDCGADMRKEGVKKNG